MNRQEERELLGEYLASCARIADGFLECCDLVQPIMPVTAERIDMLEGMDGVAMLAFLKRYEQFKDALQRTIKTIAQLMEHGRIERLTSVDIANRGLKLGILQDGERWADAVRTRNALAHEYPLQPEKRAAQVNNAWNARHTLDEVWINIQRFVDAEGLQ